MNKLEKAEIAYKEAKKRYKKLKRKEERTVIFDHPRRFVKEMIDLRPEPCEMVLQFHTLDDVKIMRIKSLMKAIDGIIVSYSISR